MIIAGSLFCFCCVKYDDSLRTVAAFSENDIIIKALKDIFDMKIADLISKNSKICSLCANKLKEFYQFFKMVNDNKKSDLTTECDLSNMYVETQSVTSSIIDINDLTTDDLQLDKELQNIFPDMLQDYQEPAGDGQSNHNETASKLPTLVRIPTPPFLKVRRKLDVPLDATKLQTGTRVRVKVNPVTNKVEIMPLSAGTSGSETVTPVNSSTNTKSPSVGTTFTAETVKNSSKALPTIRYDPKTKQTIIGSVVATKVNPMTKPVKWGLKAYPGAKKTTEKPKTPIITLVKSPVSKPFKLLRVTTPKVTPNVANRPVINIPKPSLEMFTPPEDGAVMTVSTSGNNSPVLDLTGSPDEKRKVTQFTFQTKNGVKRIKINSAMHLANETSSTSPNFEPSQTSSTRVASAKPSETPTLSTSKSVIDSLAALANMPNLKPCSGENLSSSGSSTSTISVDSSTQLDEVNKKIAKNEIVKRASKRKNSEVLKQASKMKKVDPTKAIVRVKRLTAEEIRLYTKRK